MNFRPTNIEKGEGGKFSHFQANRSNNYVTDCSPKNRRELNLVGKMKEKFK